MEHRAYDGRQICSGCRFWSEMLAQAIGGGPLEAFCLSPDGPLRHKYTTANQTCAAWKSGHLGAIDDPDHSGSQYDDEKTAEAPR